MLCGVRKLPSSNSQLSASLTDYHATLGQNVVSCREALLPNGTVPRYLPPLLSLRSRCSPWKCGIIYLIYPFPKHGKGKREMVTPTRKDKI